MKNRLKVLFLPKWYPNKFDAFDGNFIQNHAIAVNQFCDVAVIFVKSDAQLNSTYKIRVTTKHCFPEIYVYYKKSNFNLSAINSIITFFRYYKSFYLAYRFYLKNNRTPDICHIHVLAKTSPLALFLKLLNGTPYLITEHWSGYHKISGAYKGFLRKIVTKQVVKYAEMVTVVSTNLEKSMLSHGLKNKYQIISNVINTDVFNINWQKNNSKKRLIHISNLSKSNKNVHLIIDCLIEISQLRNDFEFILIGNGPDKNEMLAKINNSSLAPIAFYKGELEMEEVAKELSISDVLLLFSMFENQPYVILEALACGVPVISSDVGGISDIVNPDFGKLVSSLNTVEFRNAIIDFLDGNLKFSSQKIRQHALENYSQKKIGQMFFNLYQSILK